MKRDSMPAGIHERQPNRAPSVLCVFLFSHDRLDGAHEYHRDTVELISSSTLS